MPPRYPVASPNHVPSAKSLRDLQAEFQASREGRETKYSDPLKKVKVESELRREIRENIAHQRMIGSYIGKRHAMHLPVRGQNTQSNAKTARRLNQLDRY
jgi:small subunit ribosomal protein S13